MSSVDLGTEKGFWGLDLSFMLDSTAFRVIPIDGSLGFWGSEIIFRLKESWL